MCGLCLQTPFFFFFLIYNAVSVTRVDSFEDWSVWKLVVTLVFHSAVFHRVNWLNKCNTLVSQHKCNTPVCLCCVPHRWLHSCNTPVSLAVFHRERCLHKCKICFPLLLHRERWLKMVIFLLCSTEIFGINFLCFWVLCSTVLNTKTEVELACIPVLCFME